jgi:hypothetical protein
MRNKAKRGRKMAPNKDDSSLVKVPKTIVTDDLVSASYRYVSGNQLFQTKFTRGSLLNLIGLSYTSSQLYRVIGAIRLRRIHVWTSAATTGTANDTYFQWNGAYSKPTTSTSTTMGVSGISYQTHVPPKKSLASDWSVAGSNETEVLFSMTYNSGDVIQLDVTYMLQNAVTNTYTETSITSTGTALAIGYIYSMFLDQSLGSGATLGPVGRLGAA